MLAKAAAIAAGVNDCPTDRLSSTRSSRWQREKLGERGTEEESPSSPASARRASACRDTSSCTRRSQRGFAARSHKSHVSAGARARPPRDGGAPPTPRRRERRERRAEMSAVEEGAAPPHLLPLQPPHHPRPPPPPFLVPPGSGPLILSLVLLLFPSPDAVDLAFLVPIHASARASQPDAATPRWDMEACQGDAGRQPPVLVLLRLVPVSLLVYCDVGAGGVEVVEYDDGGGGGLRRRACAAPSSPARAAARCALSVAPERGDGEREEEEEEGSENDISNCRINATSNEERIKLAT
uniref:Uncharacterized protein n=1 Tax=Oryza sativa subsp. japonica TaxID=39947 RepID=Q8H5N2_ORYSJ|nr:hypothetical protein [Oryza sativa Japonica Group]